MCIGAYLEKEVRVFSPTFPKDGRGNMCVYISSFIHKTDYVVRDLAHELLGTSVTAQTKIKDDCP